MVSLNQINMHRKPRQNIPRTSVVNFSNQNLLIYYQQTQTWVKKRFNQQMYAKKSGNLLRHRFHTVLLGIYMVFVILNTLCNCYSLCSTFTFLNCSTGTYYVIKIHTIYVASTEKLQRYKNQWVDEWKIVINFPFVFS